MPKKKNNKNYFTQETEDAIIEYNNTDSYSKKSKIYAEKIHYPFFKLTQNIIHTFKFYHTDVEELEDLQHEIEVFLLGKMHLYHHSNNLNKRFKLIFTKDFKENLNIKPHNLFYDFYFPISFSEYVSYSPKVSQKQISDYILLIEDKINKEVLEKYKKLIPPKAYSYFGTIVKRWCIIYNKNNYNKKLNSLPLDVVSHDESYSYNLDIINDQLDLELFMDNYIDYISHNILETFKKPQEIQIANSFLEIFKKRKNLEIFHKKAIYTYIYELTPEAKTSQITKVVNKLKSTFKEKYINCLDSGVVNF